MDSVLTSALEAATEIGDQRYPEAEVVLLAGSLVRGEATMNSDLDIVVVFEKVEQASRESFRHGGWPVEAFIHDTQTLEYFFSEVDRPSGVPSLPDMVATGIDVRKNTAIDNKIKTLAQRILNDGPPAWSDLDRDNSRYAITDLVDDIRAPRSLDELLASLTRLYPAIADHFCRSRGLWAARGKTIPRRLASYDAVFAQQFATAFNPAFGTGETDQVIQLSKEVLEPDGGFLFEGYRRPAPKGWRVHH